MPNNLKAFAGRMRERARGIDTVANEITKEGVEAALRELVDVTPVDTSEAISNWQVGAGSKPLAQLPPFFAGRRGSTRASSSGKAIDDGLEGLKAKQPGQTVFLSNTAKYITDLDRGTSTQFAGGFIPRALIVFRVAIRGAAKRLLK